MNPGEHCTCNDEQCDGRCTKTCEHFVSNLHKRKRALCGKPAADFFQEKWRCQRHLIEARRRAKEAEVVRKERENK
jgi:hypothetical protein